MRFNKSEVAALALGQPSHKFEKEGVLFVKEKQEGFFRRSESKLHFSFSMDLLSKLTYFFKFCFCFACICFIIPESTSVSNTKNTSSKKPKNILLGCVLANGGKANNGRDFNFQPYTVFKNHQKCLIFNIFRILFESRRVSVQL